MDQPTEQPKPNAVPEQSPKPAAAPEQAAKPTVTYDDFAKLDLRVAKVLAVKDHPNADKLLVLDIDLGGQQRQIVAGLKPYMPAESLVGKTIIVVANLEPRKMRGVDSNGMLLAANFTDADQRHVVVLTTDQPTPPGATIS
jgi:methionyl-tRNA synthetase